MNRHFLFVAVLAIAFLLGGASVQAGILIYELSFKNSGQSVNYSFIEDEFPGYLVVDQTASTFSSVVVLIDPTTFLPYSTTGVLSGSYMTMLSASDNNIVAVAYSASGGSSASGNITTSSSENVAFQVIGATDNDVSIGGGNSTFVAKNMTGFILASAAQSGNLTAGGTPSTSGNSTFTYGFGGSSKVTAKYQSDLTKDVNSNKLDVPAALAALTKILQNNGISPQATPTPTPSPTP